MTIETEILIVGGGIAGASAAFHLADHGRRVVLLERGEVASGASGVNAGAIDSIGWGDQPDLQAHLTAGSVEIFDPMQGSWHPGPDLPLPLQGVPGVGVEGAIFILGGSERAGAIENSGRVYSHDLELP